MIEEEKMKSKGKIKKAIIISVVIMKVEMIIILIILDWEMMKILEAC